MTAETGTPAKPVRLLSRPATAVRQVGTYVHELFNLPWLVVALLYNPRIDAAYRLTWSKKFSLGWRMYRNTKRMKAATSYKAHLAMAVKLLEMSPSVEGVVVECGCFQGASAANLSLVCDIVGRDLVLYDSFEGLPPPAHGEKYGNPFAEGLYKGELDVVQGNIRKGGVIDRCVFRKGWFKDTVPHHEEPIALMFLDVDYQDSLHDCVVNLWPHLVPGGYVFIDEYVFTDYCALFYSEKWWWRYLQTIPPGLYGAGSGLPLGQFSLDPWPPISPLQSSSSIAYTKKGNTGFWDFYPEDIAAGKAADAVLNRGTQPNERNGRSGARTS
jgi:O-methyltransferase